MNPAETTLIEHLTRHARARSHKPFVVLQEGETFQVLSYGDLARESRLWAARLHAAPLPEGRRVVVLVLPHGLDVYPAFLGAVRAGFLPAILAPPSPKQDAALHWAAHRALFERVKPAAAITWSGHAEALAPLAAEFGAALVTRESPQADPAPADATPGPARAALLQHSSGTTGLKKGVVLTHAQVGVHVDALARRLDLGCDDVVASWLPLYHDMGLVTGFLLPLVLGASVVTLDPFAWTADPASILRLIARHRATVSWTPNFGLAHLARTRDPGERHDLTSLKALIDCSEPCRPETVADFVRTFADSGIGADRIACCYGMAEVVFAATQTVPGAPPRVVRVDPERLDRDGVVAPVGDGPARSHAFLSCGTPLPGVRLRIDGAQEGEARSGEILVRSRTLFAGYHLAPELDAESMTADGWHRSGDIGFLHDGELYVCGRRKELIIVHGRNLYAGDIEALAGSTPGVKPGRAVALGVPDAASGSEACVILLEAGSALDADSEAELARRVRERIEAALGLHVARIEVGPVGWLVKSTSGKMSRSGNLARLQARDAEHASDDDVGADARLPNTPAPPAVSPYPPDVYAASAEPPAGAPARRGGSSWWRPLVAAFTPPRPLERLTHIGEAWPIAAPDPAASSQAEALSDLIAAPTVAAVAAVEPVQAAPEPDAVAHIAAVAPPPDPDPPSPREAVALAVEQCFGLPAAAVHDALGPGDVGGWDSLGHTILMLRLERISRRTVGERVAAARTVGEIAAALDACAQDQTREAA